MKLQGGLGNQLFQYSLGRSFELRNNVKVTFDFDYFNLKEDQYGISLWPYQLGVFNLHLKPHSSTFRFLYKLGSKFNLPIGKAINEKQVNLFNTDNFLLKKRGYFDGYWQSPKYFEDFENEIKKEIKFKNICDSQNNECKEKILNSNSISIHVRRGDYMTSKVSGFLHDPLIYYQKAIEYIRKNVKDPTFFIFSDDIKWVRYSLKMKAKHHYVDHNSGENSYMDMILMSFCDHNIIANSTFSWWGAFMNDHCEKIVVAPKDWKFENVEHILPSKWIAI